MYHLHLIFPFLHLLNGLEKLGFKKIEEEEIFKMNIQKNKEEENQVKIVEEKKEEEYLT